MESEGVQELVQGLLGCQWGRSIMTADDDDPCEERADWVVVLHGDARRAFKLCTRHRDRVLEETVPHAS